MFAAEASAGVAPGQSGLITRYRLLSQLFEGRVIRHVGPLFLCANGDLIMSNALLDEPSGTETWPRFLSIERAGQYSCLSSSSIRRLLSAGKLTALRPCRGRVLVDRHQLDSVVSGSSSAPRSGRGIRRNGN